MIFPSLDYNDPSWKNENIEKWSYLSDLGDLGPEGHYSALIERLVAAGVIILLTLINLAGVKWVVRYIPVTYALTEIRNPFFIRITYFLSDFNSRFSWYWWRALLTSDLALSPTQTPKMVSTGGT